MKKLKHILTELFLLLLCLFLSGALRDVLVLSFGMKKIGFVIS